MRRRRDERGAAGVEAALAVTGLLLVAFFVIGGLRLIGTDGDVDAAAHAAARAAAAERDPTAAAGAAHQVAVGALADRGIACTGLGVTVGGELSPGGIVTVEVSCTVLLSDVILAGFPGQRRVAGQGIAQVDRIRGGGP